MREFVKICATGEIVEVYLRFADGIGYVGKNGVRFLFKDEYEELPA